MRQLIIGGTNQNPSTSATNYMHIGNGTSVSAWQATENNARVVFPCAGTLRGLAVRLTAAPDNGGGTQSYTFKVRRNGSEPANTLSVTISEASTTGSDTSNSVTIAAGDTVTLECTPSGTPTATAAYWYIYFDTTGLSQSTITGGCITGPSVSATNYSSLTVCGGWNATANNVASVFPATGTLKNFYVVSTADPANGAGTQSYTFTVQKATSGSTTYSDTAITVTLSEGSTSVSDLVNTLSVTAGQKLIIKCVPANTPTAAIFGWGFEFVSATEEESLFFGNGLSPTGDNTNNYLWIASIGNSFGGSTTENTYKQTYIPTCYVKYFYTEIITACGSGKTRTFKIRDGGASRSSAAISGSSAKAKNTDMVYSLDGLLLNILHVSSSTPVVCTHSWWGFIIVVPEQVSKTTRIVSAAGSDYTTLQSWYNATKGNVGIQIQEAECHEGGGSLGSLIMVYSDLVSSTNYSRIFVPYSHRHDGTDNNKGAYIEITDATQYAIVLNSYARVEGLKIILNTTSNSSDIGGFFMDGDDTGGTIYLLDNLIIAKQKNAPYDSHGMYFQCFDGQTIQATINKNIIIGPSLTYGILGWMESDGFTAAACAFDQLINNTIVGATSYGIYLLALSYGNYGSYSISYAYNNLVTRCGVCYYKNSNIRDEFVFNFVTHNTSSDSSKTTYTWYSSTTGDVANINPDTEINDSSRDGNLQQGANSIENGLDVSAYFTVDALGQTIPINRSSCRGAIEYPARSRR